MGSLTVMIVREGRQLNGFLAFGLARREDTNKLRAVARGLNMVSDQYFHTLIYASVTQTALMTSILGKCPQTFSKIL